MEEDKIYEDLQGAKVAFAITAMVLLYCYSEIIDFTSAHDQFKATLCIIGFIIIAVITSYLLIRVVDLRKAFNYVAEKPE